MSLYHFFILFTFQSFLQSKMFYEKSETKEYCRALSLSGGGAKGAYEVGVLHEMARLLNGTDAEYDVLSGISVGSINAGALSLFPIG